MSEQLELKPCPFCGRVPHYREGNVWSVQCDCGAQGPSYQSQVIAATQWNSRPGSTVADDARHWQEYGMARNDQLVECRARLESARLALDIHKRGIGDLTGQVVQLQAEVEQLTGELSGEQAINRQRQQQINMLALNYTKDETYYKAELKRLREERRAQRDAFSYLSTRYMTLTDRATTAEAEVKRLQSAMRQYSDRTNWYQYPEFGFNTMWDGPTPNGWEIAEHALSGHWHE